MTREALYTPYLAVHATPPPPTSGKPLHWEGRDAASQTWRPPEEAVLAPPALGDPWPIPGEGVSGLSLPAPAMDWSRTAATIIFYLAPVLLRSMAPAALPRVTGMVIWVRQEAQTTLLPPPTVCPALLVYAASTGPPATYVELRPHFHVRDPLHHHIVLVLQAASAAQGTTAQLYAEVLTNALAVHLLRRYRACQHTIPKGSHGLSPAKLQRTTRYIQTHLEQELSLTTLAALVHLSPDHFARLFKQATGQTPHQYILACRIARAKQLLTETDMPLSAIGLEVGCADQSYFTALFRQHVTMTPKAYRDTTARA